MSTHHPHLPPRHALASGAHYHATPTSEHELSAAETAPVRKVAAMMRVAALCQGLLVVACFVHYRVLDSQLVSTGLNVGVMGYLVYRLWGASQSLAKVTETEGRDISHLVAALEHQRGLFAVLAWVAALGAAVAVVAVTALALGLGTRP